MVMEKGEMTMMMTDRRKVIKELEECIEHIRINEFEKIPCWGNCQIAMMDALELMKEQEAMRVLSQRECETLPNHYERKGFCPKCHHFVEWYLNRSYCGFCGQEVKWDA